MQIRQRRGAGQGQEHDGDTEARILDAAHTVFMRKGTYGARMQEIADEAGVNRALLHYYFNDREGLARAVFERAVEEMFPASLRIWTSDVPFEQSLRDAVRLAFEHLEANPYLPGFLITEMHVHPEQFREMMERVGSGPLLVLTERIRAAVAAGDIRPVPLEQVLVSIHALIVFPFAARAFTETVLAESGRGFGEFIAERKETAAEFILRGLRP